MKKFTRYWQWVFMGGIALGIMLITSGCEVAEPHTASASTRAPGIWVNITGGSPATRVGPRTYVTQNPILLPDGTHAVCISTLEHLWCKEVETQ